jgi:mRNA interferase RelE/StbE
MHPALARRLRDRLRELAANPYDPRLSRQLEMDPEKPYSRIGNWRIIFAVNEAEQVLEVAAVQHRSKVYKKI